MWTNLGKLTSADKDPAAVALIDCRDHANPRTYSHGEMDGLVDACARGLVAHGLKQGDSVAIMSANRAEFLIAYFAIMRAGMVAVPVNHKLAADTIQYVLSDCQAKLVFADDSRRNQVPQGYATICFDDGSWRDFQDPGSFETVVPQHDDCAMILFTSGSTGRPKGVQLSHGGQLWALKVRAPSVASTQRMIVAAPMFHMNALASCKMAFAAHASVVLMPQFEAVKFIEAIGRHGVTWVTSVPTMMALVIREQDALAAADTSQVRYVRMGSAPATGQLYEAVHRAFPNATVAGGYGTTEAGPIVFGPKPGHTIPGNGGLGWPMPGVEVRLVDADGNDTDQGELWMRTPAVMLGYLNLPEKTREVLTEDNWYKSRDVFRRDGDGCYYFVGRIDDMFNCGGENIYPSEVEKIITRIPEVQDACVVPVDDELKGQKPVAFVVLREGASLTEDQIKRFVLDNAPPYQHPRRVFFEAKLPLAATNKVDRAALLRRAKELTAGK